jgi:hypothetical protein
MTGQQILNMLPTQPMIKETLLPQTTMVVPSIQAADTTTMIKCMAILCALLPFFYLLSSTTGVPSCESRIQFAWLSWTTGVPSCESGIEFLSIPAIMTVAASDKRQKQQPESKARQFSMLCRHGIWTALTCPYTKYTIIYTVDILYEKKKKKRRTAQNV